MDIIFILIKNNDIGRDYLIFFLFKSKG